MDPDGIDWSKRARTRASQPPTDGRKVSVVVGLVTVAVVATVIML